MNRWKECSNISKIINEVKGEGTISKGQVYNAYGKWLVNNLIRGIKQKNLVDIERALSMDWYGKSLGTNNILLHNDIKETDRLGDIGMMLWVFKKIGKDRSEVAYAAIMKLYEN